MSCSKPTTTAPPTFGEVFSGEMVRLKVGEGKTYHVHKGLIMQHSEYFRGAFGTDKFEEGETGEVTLSDVETFTMEVFINFLYTQFVPAVGMWKEKFGGDAYGPCHRLLDLRVFADRFMAPRLKRIVLLMSFDYYKGAVPRFATIALAFKCLSEDDPYLQLLVDAHCKGWTGEDEDDDLEQEWIKKMPREFYVRALKKYAEYRKTPCDWFVGNYMRIEEVAN